MIILLFFLGFYNSEYLHELDTDIEVTLMHIGYYKDVPVFRSFENSYVYIFDGEFKYFSEGVEGFYPVYCNDNVSIYLSEDESSSEVIICGEENMEELKLPSRPVWVVSSLYGDTLFFTSGEEDLLPLQRLVVGDSKTTKLFDVDYESFWVRGKGVIFSLELSDSKRKLVSFNFETKNEMEHSRKMENYLSCSKSGNYLAGVIKSIDSRYGILNLKTGLVKEYKLDSHNYFCFFYKDKAYYFKPGSFEAFAFN